MDYDTNNVIVTLTVLGGAPIQGDVPNPKAQVDLSQAATMLQDAINRGSFQIPVDVTNLQNVGQTMNLSVKQWITRSNSEQRANPRILLTDKLTNQQ